MATKPKRALLALLVLVALGLLAYAGMIALDWYKYTHGVAPAPVPGQTITTSDATPDERSVDPAATYNVPADQPRSITIDKINLSGFIQRVGVDKNNNIGVPTSVGYAGWFVRSAKPGDAGLSVIDGHVSGRYAAALFKRLPELRVGDSFAVEFGDRSIRNFAVVATSTLPASEAGQFVLEKRGDIDRQLNLITCEGVFNKHTQQYDKRLIIVAKRID